jgi:hypothetical protein
MSPIVSVHVATVPLHGVPGILRARVRAPGAIYAATTIGADLSASILPAPAPGRVGLVAVWEDDAALDAFLVQDPLAARLADGWHVRLQPLRTVGETRGIPPLVEAEQPVEPDEPVVVLTYGRTRLLGLPRFLKASARAEEAAVGAPGLLASTGFARPPRIISTFSVWRTVTEMRDYVTGGNGPGHVDALRHNAARGFHHDSLFARFRPYATAGEWDGQDPLAGLLRGAPVAASV